MAVLASPSPPERIGLPFWRGLLGAVVATAIGFVAAIFGMILAMAAALVAIKKAPLTTPGHPLVTVTEAVFYAACGLIAWRALQPLRNGRIRRLEGGDLRVLLYGIGALVLIRIGTAVQLTLMHQTKHVQSGFEHFSVVTHIPAVTVLSVALAVITLVAVGPLVEELVFRGLLFGALVPHLRVWPSAIVVALLFGIVHGDPLLFPSLAALGLVTALAYAATGNLLVPVLLHALNNSLGAAVLITAALHPHR